MELVNKSFSMLHERQKLAEYLRRCSKTLLLNHGQQAHALVERMGFGNDVMLSNDLIDMYGKCRRMDMASTVFDTMLERNVVSWTSLMCGYLHVDDAKTPILLLREMGYSTVKPNEFSLSTSLKACGIIAVVENGMQIHVMGIKGGFTQFHEVGNSIIDMYSKCGRLDMAARMFEMLSVKNIVSWNVMIARYADESKGEKSLLLFRDMQKQGEVPDEFTFTSTLKACRFLGAIREGSQVHGSLTVRGFPFSVQATIAGALIDLYVKCGYISEARKVFDRIGNKSIISWTSLILGYAHQGSLTEAMDLFRQLRQSSKQVDGFVIASVMSVFADFALVEQGEQVHSYSIKVPYGSDISVSNSIVDMYLKCGLTDEAERRFNEMSDRNVVSWTVMITGYGKHGIGKEAFCLFNRMQLDNIEPDEVTYLAVLSACSHAGLIEESQEIFSSLCQDDRVKPKVEHYACMVDLFGRAGHLKEAKSLIETMPLKPNIGIWQTLLSACRVHGDVETGREVGEILLEMDGDNPVNYVMLSHIYAEAGYWKDSERIRFLAKSKGLKKEAGQSWVEINKEVHFFYGGDKTHPLTGKILEVLKEMEKKMKEEIGYAYGVKSALHDVEEESKEDNLRLHSEKLAIGLALVCGGTQRGGRVIRIFKNLRVCGDCHEFIKGLSKVLKKTFIVRDAKRFHKIEDGMCSCKDYW